MGVTWSDFCFWRKDWWEIRKGEGLARWFNWLILPPSHHFLCVWSQTWKKIFSVFHPVLRVTPHIFNALSPPWTDPQPLETKELGKWSDAVTAHRERQMKWTGLTLQCGLQLCGRDVPREASIIIELSIINYRHAMYRSSSCLYVFEVSIFKTAKLTSLHSPKSKHSLE